MRYTVRYDSAALKNLGKLPADIRQRIREKVRNLEGDPRPPGVKKLKGMTDYYRIRVGEYRVIYAIKDDILLVIIVDVGHRGDVYR